MGRTPVHGVYPVEAVDEVFHDLEPLTWVQLVAH